MDIKELELSDSNKAILKFFNNGYKIGVNGDIYNHKGKKLKPRQNTYGYLIFRLRLDGKLKILSIHRLQAYAKYGTEIFNKDLVVRHIDSNKLNNNINNICLGTQLDNMRDKSKILTPIWASHPKYDYASIRKDRERGMKYSDIMTKYNISSKGTISYIINSTFRQHPI